MSLISPTKQEESKLQFPQENRVFFFETELLERVDMATINITDLKQLVPSGQENKDGQTV